MSEKTYVGTYTGLECDGKVLQVMSAPGWRVVEGFVDETGEFYVADIPVIGWALIQDREQKFLYLELIVFTDLPELLPNARCHNAPTVELAPGKELVGEALADLKRRAVNMRNA